MSDALDRAMAFSTKENLRRCFNISEITDEALLVMHDAIERLTRERDRARELAVSYRQSWSYAAFGELIPYDESETHGIEEWLNVQKEVSDE